MRPFIGLIRTMRPKQWTKNVVVFAGLVFDGQLFMYEPFFRVTLAFVFLCLIASTIYIINDLVDIERDRQHPKKRYRALPSGELPVWVAVVAAIVLPVFVLWASLVILNSWIFASILTVYLFINILYSFKLKHIAIIDVLVITAGYILRVAGGVFVIQVARFSPWLYGVIGLLALFLAISKRRQELITLGVNAAQVRPIFKEYNLALLDEMLRIVTTSTLIAYVLYVIEAPSALLANTNLALLTVPFVLYGLFRYLYLIYVKGEGSAPDEVILKDRPLQAAVIFWGLTFVAILYVIPRLQMG